MIIATFLERIRLKNTKDVNTICNINQCANTFATEQFKHWNRKTRFFNDYPRERYELKGRLSSERGCLYNLYFRNFFLVNCIFYF